MVDESKPTTAKQPKKKVVKTQWKKVNKRIVPSKSKDEDLGDDDWLEGTMLGFMGR